MKLIRYKTPEEVMLRMANCDPHLPVSDLAEISFGGLDDAGNEVLADPKDCIDGIKETGVWGFTDTRNGGDIHAWISPECDPATLVHFLAHEIAHNTGAPCEDDAQEEMRAEMFGSVAEQAYRLMNE